MVDFFLECLCLGMRFLLFVAFIFAVNFGESMTQFMYLIPCLVAFFLQSILKYADPFQLYGKFVPFGFVGSKFSFNLQRCSFEIQLVNALGEFREFFKQHIQLDVDELFSVFIAMFS